MAGRIGIAMVGANDIEAAKGFYDGVLAEIGLAQMMPHPSGGAIYGGNGGAMFAVVRPFDGQPARFGNGTMVGIMCDSPADVDKTHAKAIELGGSDEGAPGPRGDMGFYAAYFRDLEGNKLSLGCMPAQAS